MDCPARPDLLLVALGVESPPNDELIYRHVADCVSCQRELTQIWEVIGVVRSSASIGVADSNACLDDAAIAELVDAVDPEAGRESLAHLATCAHCRARLAAVVHLLRDPSIATEIARLVPRRRSRLLPAGALAGAMAAALAGVMLWPESSQVPLRQAPPESGARREGTVTATVAPRILSPTGLADADDSLHWTSVPRADLYRITVWNREGVVVWQGETRDTALALPSPLSTANSFPYLWKVDARTGWERWVSSELREFTIRAGRGGR